MVWSSGWTAAERTAFEAQLCTLHRTRIRLDLLDFEHRFIGSLTSARMSGGVQVQAESDEATRSLALDIFDPLDVLGLGVGETSVTPNRMVQAWRGVFVESLGRWMDVPVFCGPITGPSRTGDVLSLDALDKSALADSNLTYFAVRKGENAGVAIRRLMQAIGETRFRISSTSRRLGKDRVLSEDMTPWQAVKDICASLGWVCFYDGAGYLVCKPRPTASVYTFRAGLSGSLLSVPKRGFWDKDIVNAVHVTGATVADIPITATARVDPRNSFSPEMLGRHGKIRRKAEYFTDTGIATTQEARRVAERRTRELAVQSSTATFDALPCAYHLQEHDVYTAVDPRSGVRTKTALREMTVPLGHEGAQAMGYAARTPRTRLGVSTASNRKRLMRAKAAEARKARSRR